MSKQKRKITPSKTQTGTDDLGSFLAEFSHSRTKVTPKKVKMWAAQHKVMGGQKSDYTKF